VSVEQNEGNAPKLLVGLVGWVGILACAAGGVLWALSPIGIHLSELKFHTPNVFWKMFWPAPLLILLGLIGLRLRHWGRSGLLERLGFSLAALGLAMVIAGDIGLYWLGIDDIFIVAAPAYRAFRIGLLVLAAGSILFAVGAGRDEALPPWAALPLAIASLAGLVAFAADLDRLGASLWILFGLGWAWLGLSLLAAGIASVGREAPPNHGRREQGQSAGSAPGPSERARSVRVPALQHRAHSGLGYLARRYAERLRTQFRRSSENSPKSECPLNMRPGERLCAPGCDR
jgi:hypothetical protein